MMFSYLFIGHALLFGLSDATELPVHNMRASKALAIVRKIDIDPKEPVTLTADDSKHMIIAEGNAKGIDWVKQYLSIIDVARRQVSFKVSINSPLDSQAYEVSAKILNQQEWKTSDGDTGITCSITPRINDDGTTTFFAEFGNGKPTSTKVVFRMKSGASESFSIGSGMPQVYKLKESGSYKTWLANQKDPVITIQSSKASD